MVACCVALLGVFAAPAEAQLLTPRTGWGYKAADPDGWGPCSSECGPGTQVRRRALQAEKGVEWLFDAFPPVLLQTRVINKCGMTEERPCMGPGTLGCDGKCYPKGAAVKEVDCMGVRRFSWGVAGLWRTPRALYFVLRSLACVSHVGGLCRRILQLPLKKSPLLSPRSAAAPPRWTPAACVLAGIRISCD